MRYMPFTIICQNCGHENKPHNSPRKGVIRIFTGDFTHCNNCKAEFKEFFIPKRPMVAKIAKEIPPKEGVKLYEYTGSVPIGWAT